MLSAQSATRDYFRAENKLQSISYLFISPVTTPQVSFSQTTTQILSTISKCKPRKNNDKCFGPYFYSTGTQRGILHPAGWLVLFCVATQELVLATANTGKTREKFWKNAGEWTERVEIRKKFLAVGAACIAIYWPTTGFKGRTFKLCALNRWEFNFCIRSFPLRVR